MRRVCTLSLIIIASLITTTPGLSEPPGHAPAHGYRAKHAEPRHPGTRDTGGVQFVFDSERGISIAVDLPGVYFEARHFHRFHDGKWQVSLRADGGWRTAKTHETPKAIRKAHARRKSRDLKRKKH